MNAYADGVIGWQNLIVSVTGMAGVLAEIRRKGDVYA